MPLSIRPVTQRFQLFHIIGGLLGLILVLGIWGCSAVKMSYNNAPELSYWWLDSYLDFNETQTLKVRADLATLQSWHRATELPAYVATLEKMQRMAPSSVTPEQVCDLFEEFKPRLQALVDQVEPTVAALAPMLKADQLDHLARQLDKRSAKWREEWLDGTLAKRNARHVKQMVERAELLYGRLEQPQLAVLRASVATSAFDAPTSYRESLRRHQDALQLLRQLQTDSPNPTRARAAIHALLARSMDSPDAAYRNYMEKITQENCKAFATLHNSTTPTQRLKVIENLKDYETLARALVTQKL